DTLALASGPWALTVACTPFAWAEALRPLAPAARFVAQTDGDLGARIRGALADALERSAAAVLIGSDTPDLPRQLIDEAFEALETCDAVLGPACDGGFYLI